jgi:exodeoxyribonuclease VII large subunit
VGHEIDVTLADLTADRRALTPSEAGELAVPDVREVAMHLDRLAERIHQVSQGKLRTARALLDQLGERARMALRLNLDARRHHLVQLTATLDALSPLAVLARGYSLTFDAEGKTLIRSFDQIQPGDLIRTHLASGQIISQVLSRMSPAIQTGT